MRSGLEKVRGTKDEVRVLGSSVSINIGTPHPHTLRIKKYTILVITHLRTRMKNIIYLILSFISASTFAQTSDEAYKKPLKEVLQQVETRFSVKLNYPEDLVKDRWVTYADWRFRSDAEKTLTNILASQDLSYTKAGEKSYKIKPYEYHRWSVEDGKEKLEYLASLYHDVPSWEKRKVVLKQCMLEAVRLSPLPPKPASQPIVTARRKMDGYTVENIAIETLPGLYVCGSLYRPLKQKGKAPIVLCPDGHFGGGRYRPDSQYRCAALARMGALAFSYDLFAWGESLLQFQTADHRRSLAMTIQALNSIRILDYLSSLKEADPERVAITGGSGGGSQTMLITAIDDRIKVSVPVVMLSCYFYGGCPCESGMPVHLCEGGTNNVEMASMAAPRPQLIVSDGKDWSDHVPEIEFPQLQKVYNYYGKGSDVQNVHLAQEGHDYGISKRSAMYAFVAPYLGLNINAIKDRTGKIDESGCTIEEESAMYVFGKNGERLPANAIKDFETLQKVFEASVK
jgi:hypothetical protein